MMKFKPKKFWNMIRATHNHNPDMPIAALTEYNKKIFYDENIQVEESTPIEDKEKNYI
jgi:hypothetical protein